MYGKKEVIKKIILDLLKNFGNFVKKQVISTKRNMKDFIVWVARPSIPGRI